ncbi:hypothetical protein [Cellulomonas hominis]|uniref:hypothetical protein n=1 Tax=Cellulomonas hominis TaxID=156981 RepID=UPI001B932952|nr:hypothetical protein [Cellulomonas hominis]VTR76552.1 hypothetical protein CHMI_01313 [Cellulomonas hominis]
MSAPDGVVRRGPGVRRAALLLAGSGLALVGLVVLAVLWVGLAGATLRTGLAQDGTCVAAATAGEGDAAVTSSMLPPRAVCTWTVDGRPEETVLAERSPAVAGLAAGAAAVGLATVAGTLLWSALQRRRAARLRPAA